MTDQPRDEDGRFTELRKSELYNIRKDGTIASIDEENVTPRVEYTTVSINLLQKAIQQAKNHQNVVRIGTINNKKGDVGAEMGLVLLKPSRNSENVTVLAGRKHHNHGGNDE